MPKRILLIDSDESFAKGLSAAAGGSGFSMLTATNSEDGMTLARQENPDLIVVCVEAQPTNGYMLCTRLKKDDQLNGIPVILTSANATPDSFEKHRKLKTRAEDYLIKPFSAGEMLQKASAILGVSVEDESLGLGNPIQGEDEPIQLSEEAAAEAHVGNDESVVLEDLEELVELDDAPAPVRQGGDDELEMFDQAFDALKPAGQGVAKPQLRLAPVPQPERAARPDGRRQPTELSAPSDAELLGLSDASDADERVAQLQANLAERNTAAKALQQSAEKLRRENDGLKAELQGLRDDCEQLRKQLADAQAAAEQNEERVVKAYQKMKGDEKLREKTRKALQIALALLDEAAPASGSGSEAEKKKSA
jgi:DNA-binding response OmpR family regulator